MTRIETMAEGVTLYLGDCREIVPTLGRVDAVVTDPPYGVRRDYWDNMDEQEFARFTMSWMATIPLVTDEALIFGNIDSVVGDLAKLIFPRVRKLIWAKPPGSQLSGGKERARWFAFEAIFHCHQGKISFVAGKENLVGRLIREARERQKLSRGAVEIMLRGKKTGICFRWEEGSCLPNPKDAASLKEALNLASDFDEALRDAACSRDQTLAKMAELTALKSDVLSYRTVTAGSHPTEKPLPLMADLISHSGAAWNVILDPFMGSGTTGVAAIELGRKFIGIEADPAHFDTARKRIAHSLSQSKLGVTAGLQMQQALELR